MADEKFYQYLQDQLKGLSQTDERLEAILLEYKRSQESSLAKLSQKLYERDLPNVYYEIRDIKQRLSNLEERHNEEIKQKDETINELKRVNAQLRKFIEGHGTGTSMISEYDLYRTIKELEVFIEMQSKDLQCKEAEAKKLREDVNSKDAEVNQLRQDVDRLMSDLYRVKELEEGHVEDSRSHSILAREYEKLFTYKLAGLMKSVSLGTVSKKEIGVIFYAIYKQCKATVLKHLFEELYIPHQEDENQASARVQAKVYTEALDLKKDSIDQALNVPWITDMVEHKLLELRETRKKFRSVSGSDNKFEKFLTVATTLAWKMVTISPPMILAQPRDFDENVHEKSTDWDERLESTGYDLVYSRPALYNSYKDCIPARKVKVANKPCGMMR